MATVQNVDGDHSQNATSKEQKMHEVEFDTALKLTGEFTDSHYYYYYPGCYTYSALVLVNFYLP